MAPLRRLLALVFGLATAIVLLSVHAAGPEATADDRHVLVLGRISDDPKTHYEQLKPLLDYVVPRMADVGIHEGRILMARDAQQMASYLRRGRVDWITETAGTGMVLQQRAGARPLLLTERDGVSRYSTLFFARRDSGIRSLADLRGRKVAFQNPYSTSAYYVPAAELLGTGLPLEILLSPMDHPSPDAVGYLFARTELNIATWVHKGLVDAGAMSDLDWENPRRVPPSFRNDLVVFHRTDAVPRALEMVAADVAPAVEQRLREVLLAARSDPAAQSALAAFWGTTGFRELDEPMLQSLERLRAGVVRIHAEVE